MRILIKNANVFDGISSTLKNNMSVVVDGNFIEDITDGAVDENTFEQCLDAGGKTVIPGLIDCHSHLGISDSMLNNLDTMRIDELAIRAAKIAEDTLMRGFTTVRTVGSLDLGLKNCIDNGYATGPRIFPSHAAISQTAGHSDFRQNRAQTRGFWGEDSPLMRSKMLVVADGVPEVLKAVREQLFLGASQIKIMAGGGAASFCDPLETCQFTLEEMKAAVDAAADYGTYVCAHIHTEKAMMRAAEAGVRCFEHASFLTDELAKIMVDKDIWLCGQYAVAHLIAERKIPLPSELLYQKTERVGKGILKSAELVQKYGLKQVFGTDLVGDRKTQARQLDDFVAREELFGSVESLKHATGYANELFKLTTCMNPYPEGQVGILGKGSFADLLIVEGNPLEKVSLLADMSNTKLIMKDGIIYKNIM